VLRQNRLWNRLSELSARMSVTRPGWYYLAVVALVFAGAMMREVNLLLILAAMLCGPLLFGLWATLGELRDIRVTRRLPAGVAAGELLVGQVEVTNPGRRGRWGIVVEDRLARAYVGHDGEGHEVDRRRSVRLLFPYIPAGETRRGAYRGRLLARGRYRVGPVMAMTRFPFGLFCRQQRVADATTITVYPRTGRLTERWAQRHQEALSGVHRRERRQGPEGEFFGLRDYRSGDSMRWIHWRRSAHIGTPVVREFERPRNRDLAVVLDLHATDPDDPAVEDNIELAVSFAATLLTARCRQGGSELLLATAEQPVATSGASSADRPRVTVGAASPSLLHAMMGQLAMVEPTAVDHLPELVAATLRRIERGTEVVVVAPRPIDLAQLERHVMRRTDATGLAALRRVRVVDTSDEQLENVFQVG